ncbi:MAG: MFS transporter, partial [Solirubrobacteraceae bacterium]
VGFLAREAIAARPLIPLRIFRSRDQSGANLIQALLVAGMFGMFFLGALYLQRVLHYDALKIGLAFLPTTLVMGTMSLRYSQRLVMRFGPRRVLIGGMSLGALGLAWFAQAPARDAYVVHVLPALLVLGLGIGGSFPALMAPAMAGARPEDAGLASGLVNTTAQIGGALGLAVLATVASAHSEGLIRHGTPTASALTSGYHVAFWIGAALVVVAIAVAAFVLEGGPTLTPGREPAGDRDRDDRIPAGACTEVA